MLTRCLMVGAGRTSLQQCRWAALIPSVRGFRSDFKNPYLHDPTPMSQEERDEQQAIPVWDRVFDHKKYMHHAGPLKRSTGFAFMDVEPFPRMKLMKLYYLILQEIAKLPDEYGYKVYCREQTRYRMKIVDETENIREIEEKIAYGLVEELISAAHDEVKLLRIMQKWRPWEQLKDYEDEHKFMLQQMCNFRKDNPFHTVTESYDHLRHDRTPRDKPNQQ